ncbi:MAG TPA: hypothetical protein DCX60_10955 [Phycisphaerales bacterium]|nr:hypothetical protein [Phycisphaerales bacterium]
MSDARKSMRPLLVLMTLLSITASGCRFDTPPAINVSGARWAAVNDSEPGHLQLLVGLELENVEDEPIQLEEFEYTFMTTDDDGQLRSWSAAWLPLRTIPAETKITIEIPAVVPRPDASVDWEIRGDLSYKAPGRWAQILFDSGLRTPSTGFSGQGQSSEPMDQ